MVLFRVDKVVVVTLLEATKTTMEQVGTQRMELADRGVEDSRRLVTLYGELRRLKDYLQRCVGAFRDQVEIDLAEDDLPLLTACCRRGAEISDQRMTSCTDMRERTLIQGKRDLLIDWAVELAQEPLLELPLPNVMPALSPAMRGLRMRLSQKFARRALGRNPYEEELQALPSDLAGPLPNLDDGYSSQPNQQAHYPQSQYQQQPQQYQQPHSPPHQAPYASPHTSAFSAPNLPPPPPGRGRSGGMPMSSPMSPAAASRLPSHAPTSPPPEPERAIVSHETEAEENVPRLLEVGSIRDPRLRAMMALDLRALERAIGASDFRLAAVHLTSVLEGAIIDHAIPRTLELGLSGMPDTWNPQDVLLRIFGDNCAPRDRAAAHHVFAARALIHPALQLKSPMIVTALAFKKHIEFVQHSLRVMGFTS